MDFITSFDYKILNEFIENLRCQFLDIAMPIVTVLGDSGIIPIVIALILLIFSKTRKIGLSLGFAYIYGGVVGNLILKNVVGRLRPYDISYGINLFTEETILIDGLSDFSFPSGHTLILFEFALVLMIMLKGRFKPFAIISLITAFAVAFSRLYLYVHFPSDVLAGMILGCLFGFLGVKTVDSIYKMYYKKHNGCG